MWDIRIRHGGRMVVFVADIRPMACALEHVQLVTTNGADGRVTVFNTCNFTGAPGVGSLWFQKASKSLFDSLVIKHVVSPFR